MNTRNRQDSQGPMLRLVALLRRSQGGQAITEMVLVLPLLLFLVVAIVEVGSAFRTYQILTNGVREGARAGVIAGAGAGMAQNRIQTYLDASGLDPSRASVTQSCDGLQGQCAPGSRLHVELEYPFQFRSMGPVLNLLCAGCGTGWGNVVFRTSAVMRNE